VSLKMTSSVDVVPATEYRSLMRFPVGDATALAAAEALAAAKPTPVGTVGPRTVKVPAQGLPSLPASAMHYMMTYRSAELMPRCDGPT